MVTGAKADLVHLTQRIADAAQRGARSIGKYLRNEAELVRAAVNAFYRAEGQFATRLLRNDNIPAGRLDIRGWDDNNNEWSFTPEQVYSALLRSRDGKPIGIAYPTTFGQVYLNKNFYRAKCRRSEFEYLISPESKRPWEKLFGLGLKNSQTSLQNTPWSRAEPGAQYFSPRARTNPIYVDAHATASEFLVKIRTGRFSSVKVGVRGDHFARLTAASYHFNRVLSANPDTKSLILISCNSAAYSFEGIPTAASKMFADSMHHEGGIDKHVFGAVGTVRLMGSDLCVELPGGHDSHSPAWIQHSVDGQTIPVRPRKPREQSSHTDYNVT